MTEDFIEYDDCMTDEEYDEYLEEQRRKNELTEEEKAAIELECEKMVKDLDLPF